MTPFHRIEENRLYFTNVPLPLGINGINEVNRNCYIEWKSGNLIDSDGLGFAAPISASAFVRTSTSAGFRPPACWKMCGRIWCG